MEVSQLIERCRQGDAEALGELYKAYAQRMRRVCRRYVGNEQTVDDVLHDAFLIIFTSIDRLRDAHKAEAWMMAITHIVQVYHPRCETRDTLHFTTRVQCVLNLSLYSERDCHPLSTAHASSRYHGVAGSNTLVSPPWAGLSSAE